MREIETDSSTVLELVVNGLRMRYSNIGVSDRTTFLDIPTFLTYCWLPFFLAQQIEGYADRNNVKYLGGASQGKFVDIQVLSVVNKYMLENWKLWDWESILKSNTRDWLLEKNNPSVRYFTLIDILDYPETDSEAIKAKNDIMESKLVSEILSKQKGHGYWEKPKNFYKTKYKGTVWQLIILAELEANGEDERIKNACQFILENSQEHESGGFSIGINRRTGSDEHDGVIPCLTGNMVWGLIKFGYLKDPRVKHGINWITTYQRFDDGIMQAPKGWPYEKWEICWGNHTCHMGVVKSLKALSEIPVGKRTKAVKNTIKQGVEYLLKHHIHKRSHNLRRVSKSEWLKFGFPLMYQTDVLEILGILTKLGYSDNRMQEAIDLVLSKQNKKGRWRLENTYNDRFQTNIERKDKESKWITLHALRVLKRLYA